MKGKMKFVTGLIEEIINQSYEDGWNDCKENMTLQLLEEDRYKDLEKKFKIQKRRLSLAIKLLRYAKSTPCGANGQFDRFFEEVSDGESVDEYA
jgi:hypothetical protein